MQTRLEDDLARTLSAAATVAPGPGVDFAASVAQRRRRNRRTAVTRVAAVVLVVAGLVAAGGLRLRVDQRPDAAAVAPVDLATARPATEVWPQAVVTVPGLVDGRPAWPVGRVDDDRYLMVPGDGSLPYQPPVVLTAGTSAVYDLFTDALGNRVRTLAWASVGERSIVAVTSVDAGTYHATEVWTAPRAGGPAVKRALFEHSDRTLVVTAYEVGDTVFASVSRSPSPESAPATRIVRISDAGIMQTVVDGFRMRSWSPWATADPEQIPRPGEPDPPPVELFNVVTGERRTPRTPAGVTPVARGVEYCIGDAGDSVVAYRLDGSRQRRVTGLGPGQLRSAVTFDRSGRFAAVRVTDIRAGQGDGRSFLWDLQKNTVGVLENRQLMTHGLVTLGPTDGRGSLLDVARIR